ncbi:MAG TPA: hypothetical protein VLV76_11295 [Candidatus Acidoferrum sp.]|nr:hypothetical protein [Candidatus Acidoferrum sp.]
MIAKTVRAAMAAAILIGSLALSGCYASVDVDGYPHHHYYHDRYYR